MRNLKKELGRLRFSIFFLATPNILIFIFLCHTTIIKKVIRKYYIFKIKKKIIVIFKNCLYLNFD